MTYLEKTKVNSYCGLSGVRVIPEMQGLEQGRASEESPRQCWTLTAPGGFTGDLHSKHKVMQVHEEVFQKSSKEENTCSETRLL